MKPFAGKNFVAVVRHEKSILGVHGFTSGLGANVQGFRGFVMERNIDTDAEFNTKKADLINTIQQGSVVAMVMATKVNDIDGQGSSLVEFLQELKDAGLGDTPVMLTHISVMEASMQAELSALNLNLHVLENDDLSYPKPTDTPAHHRTGMSQIGPKLLELCGS